jgi:eukaryotic-like serine/threonine-protein kinase
MTPAKIGKYSVIRPVGSLGEGLYLGELGSRRVILRVPAENQAEASEEARKIAGLSHVGIAAQEVGLFDDQVFLASEIGTASTLEEWLAKSQPLGEQLRVVEAMADALGYLHEQGVLHRALKPSNVLMASDGCRLMNFGLVSSATALGDDATIYGAPEVLEGMPDSAQSDIYSAGVVFYEVLAGRREEARDGRVAKPLREIRPDMSREVADAVSACRERSPDWRPKDLTYLVEVVRRARGAAGASAPHPAAPVAAARGTSTPARRSAGPTFATRRPARSPVPILAAIGVVVIGVAAAWFMTRSPGPSPATRPPAPPPTTIAETAPSTIVPSEQPPPPTPSPKGKEAADLTAPTLAPRETLPTPPPPLPSPTPEVRQAAPRPVAMPPMTTLPPPTTAPPAPTTTLARVDTPPVSDVPLVLTALSPPTLKRGGRTLVDVRGTGLRADLLPALLKGRTPADGIRVLSQRFANPTLIQVFFEVDAGASTGSYTLSLGDAAGESNAVRFEVK